MPHGSPITFATGESLHENNGIASDRSDRCHRILASSAGMDRGKPDEEGRRGRVRQRVYHAHGTELWSSVLCRVKNAWVSVLKWKVQGWK